MSCPLHIPGRPPSCALLRNLLLLKAMTKIPTRWKRLYKVISVKGSALQVLQDGMENKAFMLREALSTTSWHHCNETKGSTKHKLLSETDFNEGRSGTDSLYVVDKIVRHIRSWHRVRYGVGWQRYCMAKYTAKSTKIYLSISSTRTGGDLIGGRRKRGRPDTAYTVLTGHLDAQSTPPSR